MSEIVCEEHNEIVVLRVIGDVTFGEISAAVMQHFPKVTRHLIWDYSDGKLINVTADDFRKVPAMSSKYFSDRKHGRTAFACPGDYEYGMFRMYNVFAENMPYEYAVHRTFEDAQTWVESFVDYNSG